MSSWYTGVLGNQLTRLLMTIMLGSALLLLLLMLLVLLPTHRTKFWSAIIFFME